MNLYLDVDGVLLGHGGPGGNQVALAPRAEEFIDFALKHFDCYWLTTHCDGTRESVLKYLRPYCSGELLKKLAAVHPTRFRTLKTEVLEGDFYWLEDSPLAAEVEWLKSRDLLSRWIAVDTREQPDGLRVCIAMLERALQSRQLEGGR